MFWRTSFWAVIVTIGFWIAWQANDTDPIYKYRGFPESEIVPSVADQGQTVLSDWDFSEPVRRTCPATIQRSYTNTDRDDPRYGKVYTGDISIASNAIKVGDTGLARYFELPPCLPITVDYSVQVCQQCNLYQRFVRPICFTTPKLPLRMKSACRLPAHSSIQERP